MTTLRRRTTPQQEKALNIIAGAVRTVADLHPDWVKARAAESIAKRATGTLTGVFGAAFAPHYKAGARKPGRISLKCGSGNRFCYLCNGTGGEAP